MELFSSFVESLKIDMHSHDWSIWTLKVPKRGLPSELQDCFPRKSKDFSFN